MKVEGTFLASRLARRVFVAVFVSVSAVLAGGGALVCFGSDALIRRATTEVLKESTRAIGRSLLDRMMLADGVLSAVPLPEAVRTGSVGPPGAFSELFTRVEVIAPADPAATAHRATAIRVGPHAPGATPEIALESAPAASRPGLRAVLHPQYLWSHADSALFILCVQTQPDGAAFCPHESDVPAAGGQIARVQMFRPQLDGNPWTLTARATTELSQWLPIGVGPMVLMGGGLAFLLALMGTSVYLRRLTGSLDALMRVTRDATAGRLEPRVPVDDLRDELRELGLAFNAMLAGLQENFEFQRLLTQIDTAVLERRPLRETFDLLLRYVDARAPGAELLLVGMDGRVDDRVRAGNDSALAGRSTMAPHRLLGPVALAATSQALEIRGSHAADPQLSVRLQDLGKRLAIASDAASHASVLSRQATTDALTGLLNRFGLIDHLRTLLADRSWGAAIDVIFCDLDRFKELNDAYGHSFGDAVLQHVASRMQSALATERHHLARLGGDEFALVAPSSARDRILASLRTAIGPAVQVGQRQVHLTASIGLASTPEHATTLEELLRMSDVAMYRAKAQGGGRAQVYRADMEADAAARLQMLAALREALAHGQLHLAYQPRVRGSDGVVRSVEALMRWQHPVWGAVSPAKFIPLAEESGLILELGDWALREACEQWRRWTAQHIGIEQISVNVSPVQLRSPAFFADAQALPGQYALPAGAIELEITEGAVVRDITTTGEQLTRLRAAGFAIALDDFGVGFSSLSYLRDIPFDTLKIDKSFVDEVHSQSTSAAIATAIVSLARTMHKHLVAEGVEHEAQAQVLRQMGVHELQGFHFCRPVAAEALADFAQKKHRTGAAGR